MEVSKEHCKLDPSQLSLNDSLKMCLHALAQYLPYHLRSAQQLKKHKATSRSQDVLSAFQGLIVRVLEL